MGELISPLNLSYRITSKSAHLAIVGNPIPLAEIQTDEPVSIDDLILQAMKENVPKNRPDLPMKEITAGARVIEFSATSDAGEACSGFYEKGSDCGNYVYLEPRDIWSEQEKLVASGRYSRFLHSQIWIQEKIPFDKPDHPMHTRLQTLMAIYSRLNSGIEWFYNKASDLIAEYEKRYSVKFPKVTAPKTRE